MSDKMAVWYKETGDTNFTAWTYEKEKRPDEKVFTVDALPPEYQRYCSIVWNGTDPSLFVPADIDQLVNSGSVKIAADLKKSTISGLLESVAIEPVEYDGNTFFADTWSMKTIESTLIASMLLGLTDADPAPTSCAILADGFWLTAEQNTDGSRVVVPMTVGRLKGLYLAVFGRTKAAWGAALAKIAAIDAMVAGGASPEEIAAYNVE